MPAGLAADPSPPDTGLVIEISVPDARWYTIDDALQADVGSAARMTIGRAGADTGDGAEISIVLGDDGLVHGLNRDYRDTDRATNVLSFALTDRDDEAAGDGPTLFGDVVLAYDTVAREALEQSKSMRDHALHLVVHGVLHLIGYDHGTEAEARVMERMEQRVLADLGIADPYLERPPPA